MTTSGLYLPEPLSDVELAPWFKPIPKELNYQKYLPPNFFDAAERSDRPEHARAIILRNNFKRNSPAIDAYVCHWADEGERLGLPVYVFSLGDFTDHVQFDPRVWALRLSLYTSTKTDHDIAMPTMTEDNAREGISIRPKTEKPCVSFCGMGNLPTWRAEASYHLKNAYFEMRSWFDSSWRARKLGVYWRRKTMAACVRSPQVSTLFIVRRTFSASSKTIELDPAQARKEYLDSIVNSDFVLAPKGDGNYSNRFLKTLCMGRIPVIVDTDIVLPFEDTIDYSQISVRVPMNEVRNTPRYIRAFYNALSPEEWEARQRLARETFERYLRQDSFLSQFFAQERHAKTM